MLVNELTNQALNICGVADSVTDTPESEDAAKAIRALNFLISSLNSDYNKIPNYNLIKFDIVAGVNSYTLGVGDEFDVNLEHKILDFSQNAHLTRASTNYSVSIYPYDWYLQSYSLNSVSNIPTTMLLKRFNNYWELRFWNKPNTSYVASIRVKQALPKAELNSEIDFPEELNQFLIYKTAYYLANNFYSKNFTPQQMQILKELEKNYNDYCEVDNSSVVGNKDYAGVFGYNILTAGRPIFK